MYCIHSFCTLYTLTQVVRNSESRFPNVKLFIVCNLLSPINLQPSDGMWMFQNSFCFLLNDILSFYYPLLKFQTPPETMLRIFFLDSIETNFHFSRQFMSDIIFWLLASFFFLNNKPVDRKQKKKTA